MTSSNVPAPGLKWEMCRAYLKKNVIKTPLCRHSHFSDLFLKILARGKNKNHQPAFNGFPIYTTIPSFKVGIVGTVGIWHK